MLIISHSNLQYILSIQFHKTPIVFCEILQNNYEVSEKKSKIVCKGIHIVLDSMMHIKLHINLVQSA